MSLQTSFSHNQHEGNIDFPLLEWVVFLFVFFFCLKVVLVEYAHWASALAHHADLLLFLSVPQTYSTPWSGLKTAGPFWSTGAKMAPLQAWRICSKDVSRDCLLSHGGFWRSRVSSLEPGRKKKKAGRNIRTSFSKKQLSRQNKIYYNLQTISITKCVHVILSCKRCYNICLMKFTLRAYQVIFIEGWQLGDTGAVQDSVLTFVSVKPLHVCSAALGHFPFFQLCKALTKLYNFS